MEETLMSPEELAKYLGVSTITIYRYLKQKKIPAIKIGRLWKFKREKIEEWLKKQER